MDPSTAEINDEIINRALEEKRLAPADRKARVDVRAEIEAVLIDLDSDDVEAARHRLLALHEKL